MVTYHFQSTQAVYLQALCEDALATLRPARRAFLDECRLVVVDDPLFACPPGTPLPTGATWVLRGFNAIHVVYLNPKVILGLRLLRAYAAVRTLLRWVASAEQQHRADR